MTCRVSMACRFDRGAGYAEPCFCHQDTKTPRKPIDCLVSFDKFIFVNFVAVFETAP